MTTLPDTLPIFPLPGVVLMPRIALPLNIFEPRYLAMIDHALRSARMIGMIQPRGESDTLYGVGCAGRITAFEETGDGRYLITLTGLCRFSVAQELPLAAGGFREVTPNWEAWRSEDLAPVADSAVCRAQLLESLKPYLAKMDMSCDQWDTMRDVSCDRLVSTLIMICPFAPDDKQMLLETVALPERMKALRAFLDTALTADGFTGAA